MHRPASPTVTSQELVYDLAASPRCSLDTVPEDTKHDLIHDPATPQIHPATPPPPPPTPSIRLLFSLIPLRKKLVLLVPAIITSMISGGIAPFFTVVIGQVFAAFAKFPRQPNPPQDAKDRLLHDIGLAGLQLVGLAVGSIVLASITSSLWIWTGELNTLQVRKRVYNSVTRKEMAWFDMSNSTSEGPSEDGPLGVGGLMAKFTRETDDVRNASSLAAGMVVQYLTTCLTCLILALVKSWALTLVILCSVPALLVIQAISQVVAGPLLASERAQNGVAGTLIDRAVNAITTVKAFNAEKHEQKSLHTALSRMKTVDRKLNAVWGLTSSFSQFTMMSMFVQGFWFGAKLVRGGKIAAGDVMAVFWACLIATSNLQLCVPQIITMTRGKFAIASLLSLVDSSTNSTNPDYSATPSTNSDALYSRRSGHLKKIIPPRCSGELSLHDISFAYPSRPSVPVLKNVSLYLPANETTFICGGSGSGKSTVAQLLLRLYKPSAGSVQLDDQDLEFLDKDWFHEQIAAVSQGCILFDMSVHDNVAMGLAGSSHRRPEDVTRQEVVEACTSSLMHEFIRDLPEGYDTRLGTGGSNLSGGQRQRLAIARAKIRDPTVLILDEATSALDPTSRILVFEAIKHWRKHKTTIVITHDLSQITAKDFVYVLKDGEVSEQGYRSDLESLNGEFHRMMVSQGSTGGFLPTAPGSIDDADANVVAILQEDIEKRAEHEDSEGAWNRGSTLPRGIIPPATNVLLGNWMFDVVTDLTAVRPPTSAATLDRDSFPLVRSQSDDVIQLQDLPRRLRKATSIQVLPGLPPLDTAPTTDSRRYTLQFTPTTPSFSFHKALSSTASIQEDYRLDEKTPQLHLEPPRRRTRLRSTPTQPIKQEAIEVTTAPSHSSPSSNAAPTSTWQLLKEIYPTIPYKWLVFIGLGVCTVSGAMTPVFSFLLSRLLYEVSIGATNISMINLFGGVVLAAAMMDSMLLGIKYFLMESTAMLWVNSMRNAAFRLVLAQDKKWFDKSEHSPVRLVQILIKDGDEARNLIAIVLGQAVVVTAMLSVGLIWAMARGWQLTLVGFAIAPVFAGVMAIQTKFVSRCELNNKRAREAIAQVYYEAISNVAAIRSMSLDKVFQVQFDQATDAALTIGVKGAFVEGATYGISSGIIYLAEALLFYVGAVLITREIYTYLQMVEVLNLVVFTVTIGSQLMTFTDKIAKSVQATHDINTLLRLSDSTDESVGQAFSDVGGSVTFNNVHFAYPERPDVPVLKGLDLQIHKGENVAIVGTSGSGKSTIAALLQRLYEPANGFIHIDSGDIRSTDVHHLRHHIAVVSQIPHLFDTSVAENISYGSDCMSSEEIKQAAMAANAHDFVSDLPDGYATRVGENSSLISGGQAQRLQIARALARPSHIMILDECTSALDPSNQAAIMDAIYSARAGRTLVMITHKLPIMRTCDRIIVLHEGRVAEHGSYDELMDRKGLFASLTTGGEWAGE